ncbi:MAG: hypothetical protein WCL51_17495 [Bacteroidota bacterium]
MTEVTEELSRLYNDDFRPDNWETTISNKTGKSISLVKKILSGERKNINVAIAIISFFASEKRRILNEIKKSKV